MTAKIDDGLTAQQRFRLRHPNAQKLADKKHKDANREKVNLEARQYRKENPEVVAKSQKDWHQKNSGRVNFLTRSYQAAKLQATPLWANKEKILEIYIEADKLNLQVDHIVPLQSEKVCGLHCEANLQLLTAENNKTKGNRWWPDMWI